jgi:hypothetical protein
VLISLFFLDVVPVMEAQSWEAGEATLQDSELRRVGRRYTQDLSYSFEVDGDWYEGDTLTAGWLTTAMRYALPRGISNRMYASLMTPGESGETIEVWYDPANPTRNALSASISWTAWISLVVGAGFLFASVQPSTPARSMSTSRRPSTPSRRGPSPRPARRPVSRR